MRKFIFYILLLPYTLLFSCSNFEKENVTSPDVYESNIIWKIETETCGGNVYSNQYDKYLYFIENVSDANDNLENYIVKIGKVDLENGIRCWTSECVESKDFIEPVKCGNYIFLQGPESLLEIENDWEYANPIIYCFDDVDGKLLATISVGNDDKEKYRNSIFNDNLCPVNDKYLLWSFGWVDQTQNSAIKEGGILKFDISKIDFSLPPAKIQYVAPECIYSMDRKIRSNLLESDGYVYFESWTELGDESDVIFGAVNIESEELIWTNKSSNMTGNGENALYLLNDYDNNLINRLYSFEKFLGCYDSLTGKPIWEIQDADLGGLTYNSGAFYNEGYFYYSSANPEDPNIMCMDAETGKPIWKFRIPKSGSQFSRPIVIDGKMFFLSWGQGLWVFDAKTGKLIGCDDSICSGWYTKNALYNGNLILFDFHDLRVKNATILAIKP